MKWFLKVLKQYVDFHGRARRKECWMFILFSYIFMMIAILLDFVIGSFGIITMLYCLAIVLPTIAVQVRRLHDIGKSGAMILVGFIPVVGGIWLLILLLTDSQPGENQYGSYPKEVVNTATV